MTGSSKGHFSLLTPVLYNPLSAETNTQIIPNTSLPKNRKLSFINNPLFEF